MFQYFPMCLLADAWIGAMVSIGPNGDTTTGKIIGIIVATMGISLSWLFGRYKPKTS